MNPRASALTVDPRAKQMADESIGRILDAQTRAIWPQELPLLQRYPLPCAPRILDAGCGTGDVTFRLAEHFCDGQVLGVDIIENSLQQARRLHSQLAPRLSFENRSIFNLELPNDSFDLTLCRHVVHSIPHAEQVLRELIRVTKSGGYLHVIAEDYGMIHFEQRSPDLQAFWHVVSDRFTSATKTDMYSGRHLFGLLSDMAVENIAVDYIIVDTLRVERTLFAAILEGWRDGFAGVTAEVASIPHTAVLRYFEQMIGQVRDPTCYAVWMVPVVSARVV